MQHKIATADQPFDIVWDEIGVPHVYASTVADAYRGMGYTAGSQRLWQIHLSTLFATGQVASVLGERFVISDAVARAFNVPGDLTGLPDSRGDWVVDAYLEGLNAYVQSLETNPEEFANARTTPRPFTRADVAARYRFTSWFQHRSWPEKLFLGRLMATHSTDQFRRHLLRFSDTDADLVAELEAPLKNLNVDAVRMVTPEMPATVSGSNNWAVTGRLTASGKGMLATDPHQPHAIPNTFFYVHLHTGDWDVFGAAFPGVPYFMMGHTRKLAWGLTTGFIDNYDVYIEKLADASGDSVRTTAGNAPLIRREETISVRDSDPLNLDVIGSRHGPLLEPLMAQLGLAGEPSGRYRTALRWALGDLPTSAGALAELPLASSAVEFGELLFENDVCPLVNNIICVDCENNLHRYIAATLPVRRKATGMVPLPGWDDRFDFELSRAVDLTVEVNPSSGYSLTANNDTLGSNTPYPIHNFPTFSARADRIRELLEEGITREGKFGSVDFEAMQLDLLDLRARHTVADIVSELQGSDDTDLQLAVDLLNGWDHTASPDSAAACLYYPFQDRGWHVEFMATVLGDDLIRFQPLGAPGLNMFSIADFTAADSPWLEHRDLLRAIVRETMKATVIQVRQQLGDPETWQWGRLHQIQFAHRLSGQPVFSDMSVGPDPIGGSPTTLRMAVHMRNATGDNPVYRVYHGPAYRLVVDLADPDHCRFVIAGGNTARPGSLHIKDHYERWLKGDYFDLTLIREELGDCDVWNVDNS